MWEILGVGGLSFGATTALVTALLVVLLSVWSLKRPAANMPPGPLGYPFIGNLLDLSYAPWLDYLRISKKYGPIFSHKLVTMQTVVVNNLELTKEALLQKQVEFAGRPHIYSIDVFTEGGKDIAFGDYGAVWKAQRKIGHSAIRTYAMGKNLEDLNHEVYVMIEEMFQKKMDKGPFDPKDSLYLITYNIISTMLFGCKYSMEDKEFKGLMDVSKTAIESFGNGLAADVIPFAKYIPTTGVRMIKRLTKQLLEILYGKLKEHKEHFDPDHLQDLIDFFLNAQKEAVAQGEDEANKLTDTHVVQMISDVFFAGTDTSIFTMYWAIAFMAANPEMQVKVHREICDLIGEDRYPQLADQKSLPYTSAVMRETMRRGIVAPLLVPHATTCDTELGGYFIPKNTMVIFNMFALHFDPKEWNDDPQEFKPERFLDQDGNLLPKPAAMMPFGAGRRVCMGEILAKSNFFLLFSFFFQRFRVSSVPGMAVPGKETSVGGGAYIPKPYSITISRWE